MSDETKLIKQANARIKKSLEQLRTIEDRLPYVTLLIYLKAEIAKGHSGSISKLELV